LLKKNSAEYNVYQEVKNAIIHRRLAPGQQLTESIISEHLKVSRSPIRNALKTLADEGYVNLIKNRGAFVANPTKEEILQAYDLRKELEKMAAVRAMNHFEEKDFEALYNLIEEEKGRLTEGDVYGYVKSNKSFHMYIANRSNNLFLPEFIEKLINQTTIYIILFDPFFTRRSYKPLGTQGHLKIIHYLKTKQEGKLIETVDQHFQETIESLSQKESIYRGLIGENDGNSLFE